jgi:NADPH:quinone reductase-like Zn-dependent oxidoreductase
VSAQKREKKRRDYPGVSFERVIVSQLRLPVRAVRALRCICPTIEDTAHPRAGQTILIQGGAGGVAGFAVKLCKHLEARVITTASVRRLGAGQVIDYNLSAGATRISEPQGSGFCVAEATDFLAINWLAQMRL